jgi:ribosome-associated heat shock protein Hsp15
MTTPKNKSNEMPSQLQKVRLDQWLWAARFYKTRAIAKQAIAGGKVHCEGARTKPSKEIGMGLTIVLKVGFDEKTVIVKKLAERRKSALEAQLLYEETTESIEQRQLKTDQRKSQPTHWAAPTKPNKKNRRLIHKFKQGI